MSDKRSKLSSMERSDREGYRREMRALSDEELEDKMLREFPWYREEHEKKRQAEEHYRREVEKNRRI